MDEIFGRVAKHYGHECSQNGNGRIQGYCAAMKVRDVLSLLNEHGWYLIATKGSHRQYKHPIKAGRVTVSGKPNDDLPQGTMNSILRQAELKK